MACVNEIEIVVTQLNEFFTEFLCIILFLMTTILSTVVVKTTKSYNPGQRFTV